LISAGCPEDEAFFRSLLELAGAEDKPQLRHYAVAAIGLELHRSQVPLPIITFVLSALKKQSDAELQEALVAFLNNTHLIIARGELNDMYKLESLQKTEREPRYVKHSSMFFVKTAWAEADAILSGRL
jgi:hypothetical protein